MNEKKLVKTIDGFLSEQSNKQTVDKIGRDVERILSAIDSMEKYSSDLRDAGVKEDRIQEFEGMLGRFQYKIYDDLNSIASKYHAMMNATKSKNS